MKLVRHLKDMPYADLARGSVVTIGSFDGLHLGHRQLLDRVLTKSESMGVPSIVMSFEPTPKEFFAVTNPPARLMRFREKFDALAECGVDIFYCPRFNSAMRGIGADAFIRQILIHGMNARYIVVGDDFQFASKREGSIVDLLRTRQTLQFGVDQIPSIIKESVRVSSTAIRAALAEGDLARATALLGRPYRMSGRIVQGRQVGRTLGFATANVDLRRRLSAVTGIFAVRVSGLREGRVDGVASVGTRPTFNLTKPILEVHLFNFNREIYGEYIHVDFVAHLRDEERFESIDELVAQMREDAENARSILAASAA
ncbi:MAG: bifunctional riboflavin kinase/FAD synthetase [Woeseiaceae bacterium]|nr:bifunctional riboflavin kinase/FAD synthetase [Woeseiaceae bacterium]